MFKLFFSIDGNEIFMKDLLESLFKNSVEVKKVVSEFNVSNKSVEGKTGRLDLVAILQDETIVNLEMQVRKTDNIISRMTLYNSRLVSQQLKSGDTYDNLRPTISIVFLDYEVPEFAGLENPIHETIEVFKEDREREANRGLQVKYYIELPKFRKLEVDMNEKINQWLAFIDNKDRRLVEMAIANNAVIRVAQDEIKRIKKNDDYSRYLDSEFKEAYERAYDEYVKARSEQEMQRAEQERKRSEKARQRSEEARQRSEEARQRSEEERKRSEEARQRSEKERKRSEKERKRYERENAKLKQEITEAEQKATETKQKIYLQIVDAMFTNGYSKDEIAKITKISKTEVDEILQSRTA